MLAEAADIKASAGAASVLDGLLRQATQNVDGQLVRPNGLYPTVVTWSFDWPSGPRSRAWRLWLDERTLISLTSATSGGVTLDPAQLLPYPQGGPPYTAIETYRGGDTIWGGGESPQNDITITGVGGYRNDEQTAGTLATALPDATGTSVEVSGAASALIGVGDLLRIGGERMIVTNRTVADSGQDLAAGLTAQNNATALTVSNTSGFGYGERLLVDGERMIIEDITPTTLIVRRATGTALEAHSIGATVYAYRTLIVERGALGTTAAAHSQGDTVVRWVPPALATELCLAEALNTGQQRLSAYARVAGSGESQREYIGRGLKDIRADARRALGRRSRMTAV